MSGSVEEKESYGQGSSDSEVNQMPVGSLVNTSPWGRVAAATSRTRTTAVDVVAGGARETDPKRAPFHAHATAVLQVWRNVAPV